MTSQRNWAEQARVAGRQLNQQMHAVTDHVRARMSTGYSLTSPMVALALVFVILAAPVLLSAPVAAQDGGDGGDGGDEGGGDGSGIVDIAVCNSAIGTLLSAVFSLLVLALSGFGVFRGGNGLRKLGDPRSQMKQEGREEIKGGLMSLAGAVLVLISPQLLTQLGLSFANCISIGGV